MAVYDIDLLRALFVDKLNDNTIFLASFYEQLQDDEQINRYVDTIKELLALQNREKSESNYKAMGIIAQSGNAEIINIKQNYISPLEYQARFDIELNDRDYVLGKLKTLIDNLRGRKFDMVSFQNGNSVVFSDVEINTSTNKVLVQNNKKYFDIDADIAFFDTANLGNNASFISHISSYFSFTSAVALTFKVYGVFETNSGFPFGEVTINRASNNTMTIASFNVLESNPSQNPVVQYKLSLSFDGIQSQEPFINNGVDRVFLFFGGSATVVKQPVELGNDIVKTTIQIGKNTGGIYDVEPTEIPASLSVSDDTFQTYANGYRTQDRNMAIGNKMAYSFIYSGGTLLDIFYQYARFGTNASTYAQQIFTIKEYRYSFGEVKLNTVFAKLGDVATSNTNGDVMTISVNFKIGDY
jgi:hypothetical protein